MTSASDLLIDGFGRVREGVDALLEGLTLADLRFRPEGRGNPIGWLAWHLTRVQDDHVAGVAGTEQVWTGQGFEERAGLPFDPDETGYGQAPDEAAGMAVDAGLLRAYHVAVHDRTVRFLRSIADEDLDRVVDRRWDPPVTLGVRLVSVLADDLEHLGQAEYVRGILPGG